VKWLSIYSQENSFGGIFGGLTRWFQTTGKQEDELTASTAGSKRICPDMNMMKNGTRFSKKWRKAHSEAAIPERWLPVGVGSGRRLFSHTWECTRPSSPPPYQTNSYSPECVEEEFSEVMGISSPGPLTNRGGASAFILPLAALYSQPLRARPFTLRPLRIARDLGWCNHDYSRCGGHATETIVTTSPTCSAHRLLSWGRSSHHSHVTGLPPFAMPRSYAAGFLTYVPSALPGDLYIRQRFAAGRGIDSLGNIVGQIRVRIKATAPRLFGRNDEVISVGVTVGALQDDMIRVA
jgi:hypothetical protein